jgi:hypothetical protein
MANGNDGHSHAPAPKKGKGKKAMDQNEAERLLKARISQLEQDQAGEKDQEAEIGMRASHICSVRSEPDQARPIEGYAD